jgi:SAM-dependent methyltransferase
MAKAMTAPGSPGSDSFWRQFGLDACPRFDGQRVLEIGCGFGSRCVEAADHGAQYVLGIDTNLYHVETATSRRDTDFPQLAGTLEFRHCRIEDLPDGGFDAIVSENAFEHIMNPDVVLEQIRRKLNVGGRAYIGFGPLYHSPYGDHGWLRAALPLSERFSWPWGHLLVPERILFQRLHRLKGLPLYRQTHDWAYMDLNKLTIHDYERLFAQSGLEIRYFDTNVAYSRLGKTVRFASRLAPFLRKYLTFNVCVILASRDRPSATPPARHPYGERLSGAAPRARRPPQPPA